MKHVSQIAQESGIAEKITNPIISAIKQPEHCPWCNAERLGVDGPLHVFRCMTMAFIWLDKPGRKPLARRSRACMEAGR